MATRGRGESASDSEPCTKALRRPLLLRRPIPTQRDARKPRRLQYSVTNSPHFRGRSPGHCSGPLTESSSVSSPMCRLRSPDSDGRMCFSLKEIRPFPWNRCRFTPPAQRPAYGFLKRNPFAITSSFGRNRKNRTSHPKALDHRRREEPLIREQLWPCCEVN